MISPTIHSCYKLQTYKHQVSHIMAKHYDRFRWFNGFVYLPFFTDRNSIVICVSGNPMLQARPKYGMPKGLLIYCLPFINGGSKVGNYPHLSYIVHRVAVATRSQLLWNTFSYQFYIYQVRRHGIFENEFVLAK